MIFIEDKKMCFLPEHAVVTYVNQVVTYVRGVRRIDRHCNGRGNAACRTEQVV